jgi:hypothetical protein
MKNHDLDGKEAIQGTLEVASAFKSFLNAWKLETFYLRSSLSFTS